MVLCWPTTTNSSCTADCCDEQTNSRRPQATRVLAYQKYQYGAQKDGFISGFVFDDLPDDLTRYIAYGGAASAPSENKAWYFGGLQTPSKGPVYYGGNATTNPTNATNRLITLDMSVQQLEKWSNKTLPSSIKSRANPEVVWVPIGSQGILVVLGGVDFPEFATAAHKSANPAQSVSFLPALPTIDGVSPRAANDLLAATGQSHVHVDHRHL